MNFKSFKIFLLLFVIILSVSSCYQDKRYNYNSSNKLYTSIENQYSFMLPDGFIITNPRQYSCLSEYYNLVNPIAIKNSNGITILIDVQEDTSQSDILTDLFDNEILNEEIILKKLNTKEEYDIYSSSKIYEQLMSKLASYARNDEDINIKEFKKVYLSSMNNLNIISYDYWCKVFSTSRSLGFSKNTIGEKNYKVKAVVDHSQSNREEAITDLKFMISNLDMSKIVSSKGGKNNISFLCDQKNTNEYGLTGLKVISLDVNLL